MTDDNVFKQAARYGDAETEEHGLEEACARQGLDMAMLMHIAQQRALRVALMASGRPQPPAGLGEVPVALSPDERRLIQTVLMPAYLDGIYIGWRARALHDAAAGR